MIPLLPRLIPAGTPLSQLDTPAMLVDLELAERNVGRLMAALEGTGVSVRPHLKTVKNPEFARLLLAAGARGVCVAKLSEAEVMAAAGIEDILITTELGTGPKLERLVALLREHSALKVVVDSVAGADALERALTPALLSLQVLVDVDVGQGRTGVLPGAATLELAQHIAGLSRLRLIGLQGYEGHLQHVLDPALRAEQCGEAMMRLTSTASQLRAAGHPIGVVSTGGTGTAEICARYPGITEVQPGSFIFLDTSYRAVLGTRYECALSILTSVISRPRPGEAVVDAGLKSLSTDSGFAQPKAQPGMSYRPAGDEHGVLSWNPASGLELELGARVELLPSHIDTTVNLHDLYYVLRQERLVAVWPVAARGKVQ